MNSNSQMNYVVFEVRGVSRALDYATDFISYDDREKEEERIEVVLYAIRTSIDRLHSAHDRLEDALRMLRREKQCGEEGGKENAESGKDDK